MKSLSTSRHTRWPPILMYHNVARVAEDPEHIYVSPEQFEAQMLYLKHHNLRGVSVHELLRAMRIGEAIGLIGITFDDGSKNFSQTALPILEKFSFSATVFVVVDGMFGAGDSWSPVPEDLLEVDQVREIIERGMEVGSHSMSHLRLSGSSDSELLNYEIARSREVLSETLGKEVEGFCYPYGALDDRAAQAVQRAGYSYACSASAWRGVGQGGIYRMPRIHMGDGDGTLRVSAKLYVYSQYTKLPPSWSNKIAHPLIRKHLKEYWFR